MNKPFRRFVLILATMLLTFALAVSTVTVWYPQHANIYAGDGGPEDPLEAWSEASMVCWKYNSSCVVARNMSTNMVDYINNTYASWSGPINDSITDVSGNGGGWVYVREGNYSGCVVLLKNATRLTLARGAVGITVSINTGAYCTLDNQETGICYEYKAGTLVSCRDVNSPAGFGSYLISVVGSTYSMMNLTSGKTDYQSTNASKVINFALGNGTGIVHLKLGAFTTDSSIIMDDDDILEGEGRSVGSMTVIQLATNVPANTHIITTSASGEHWHIGIRNLELDGHKHAQINTGMNGINAIKPTYWSIQEVTVRDMENYGIYFTSDAGSIGYYNYLTNVFIKGCSYGYYLTGADQNWLYSCTASEITNWGFFSLLGSYAQSCYTLKCGTVGSGGGWRLNTAGTILEMCVSDQDYGYGLSITGQMNTVSNMKIFNASAGNLNGAPAIYLQGANNTLENIKVYATQPFNDYALQLYGTGCINNRITRCSLWAYTIIAVSIHSSVPVNSNFFEDCDNYNYDDSTYSYVISTDGTNYYSENGRTGVVYSSTNASRVERFADGNLTSGGTIFVKSGTYQINSGWIISKKNHLIGEPGGGVVLNVTANSNAITVDPTAVEWTNWGIENVNIEMNWFLGNGIYSLSASYSDSGRTKALMNSIQINNVTVGYAGINLTNVFCLTTNNIQMRTNGTGMYFGKSVSLKYGNSKIDETLIILLGVNTVGLSIISDATNEAFNLAQFNRLQVGGAGTSYDGTIGIYLENETDISFYNCDLEGSATQVLLNASDRINFANPFICSSYGAGYYGVRLILGSDSNQFRGGYIATGQLGTSYSDESTGTGTKNLLDGVKVYSDVIDLGTRTMVENCYLWRSSGTYGTTEYTATAVNVTATTWTFTHGLYTTPLFVVCSFNSTEPYTYKWTSTTTVITITCVNNGVADQIRACYIIAKYNPNG